MAKHKESEIVELVVAPERQPLLSVGKLLEAAGKAWDTLEPAFAHGSKEAGSLLYSGSAFVLYQHEGTEQQQHRPTVEHGPPIEAVQQPERTTPDHEIGGMER